MTTVNPFRFEPTPLHYAKITVWYGFTASFIVGLFFIEQTDPVGPDTCTVN